MNFFEINKYTFRIFLVFLIFLFGENGIAQTSITGKVINEGTKRKIIGANIALFKNGDFIRNTITNAYGNYSLIIDPGTYEIEFSKIGFPTERLINVIVTEGQTTKVNYQLLYERHMCGLVTQMRIQLANIEKMESGQALVENTFKGKPNREISEMIMMTPGVTFSQ